MHILNLCTTLTVTTAVKRHTTHSSFAPAPLVRVDVQSPMIAPVLAELARVHPSHVDIVAHVAPPVHFQVTIPTFTTSKRSKRTHGLILLDNFMTEWTRLVGDPVMSKWIIVTLGVSILLNGYLLKGIASGSASGAGTRGAGGAAAAAAAALLGAWETEPEDDTHKKIALSKRWSGDVLSLAKLKEDPNLVAYHQDRSREAHAHVAATPITQRPTIATQDSTTHEINPTFEKPMPNFVVSPATKSVPSFEKEAHDRPSLDGQLNGNGPAPLSPRTSSKIRPLNECVEILKTGLGAFELTDEEVILMTQKGKIAPYALEKVLQDFERAVKVRRAVICEPLIILLAFWDRSPYEMEELTRLSSRFSFLLLSPSLCH